MKKFFIILGSVFLALIVLGAIGISFLAVRGGALDKEGKAYADTAIPMIVNGWNEKQLLDRASPEFNKAVTQQQLDKMFHWFTTLGSLKTCDPAQGEALMSSTTQTGNRISAQYVSKATFQKGDATIKLGLIKHGDQWQITSFYVDSPALLPN